MVRNPRIGLVAGEASGDALGGGLIDALRDRLPDARFMGVAGPRMIAAGCEPWHRTEELSVMGLAEVLRHLPRLIRFRRHLLRRFLAADLDLFVGIDSPDFNLPLESALKRAGIPTVQYVSPQVWAWRQSRVANIRKSADRVLCLLPFETAFYEAHGVGARFVGHPLADEVPMDTPVAEAKASLDLDVNKPSLALLPGSRGTEVARLARPFLDTVAWMRFRRPELQVIAGLANESTAAVFLEQVRSSRLDPPPAVHIGRARQVMAAADVVLTASGTASLETMLTKRPMVVAYIVSAVTHRLVRFLGFRRLPHFALPNLLAGRRVVPEFLQGDVRADVLGPALESYLDAEHGQGKDSGWHETFRSVHERLRRNASDRAASAVVELMNTKTS
ncbi:MAG: lipid-A-disaccharide synthase [Rhodospirillaceae bacterium]|nr:lipid-A-disaccharide synthase [Rhodospirillaceae bacterium]